MRYLFLDCTTGVSGDMLLASLSHACDELEGLGAGLSFLCSELDKLDLAGFEVREEERRISGIVTRYVDVRQTADQPLRHIADLTRIVESARLDPATEQKSLEAIKVLGKAEAKVHGTDIETVHFHEIGAVDTIVDIVGAVALVHHMGVEKVFASAVDLGSGFVDIAHGRMAVPPPACAELSKGMTTFSSGAGMERATPTGLALLRTLADGFGPQPMGEVQAVGYGCGGRSSDEQPTFVRAFVIKSVSQEMIMAGNAHD